MIGKREVRFTAVGRTNNNVDAYDDDGKLIRTDVAGETTQFQFWGSVMDMKSAPVEIGGKRHNIRTIEIGCDQRSIANLTIDHYLLRDSETERYQIMDIFDFNSDINFSATIIAQNNM